MHEMLVGPDDAAAFEAHCRPYGGSLAGVLAATAVTVHGIGGEPVYRTVVPFHTRAKSRWLDSVGWYVGGAPIEIPMAGLSDFRTTLERVRTELRSRHAPDPRPHRPRTPPPRHGLPPDVPDLYSIVSFVDARGVPGSERWPSGTRSA
ncbi:hypothetical protein GCM10020221_26070 [Streptomyces thioluteus]|uniref:Uncharacterized protein n=1 Tax=Streptomyces thioluteus TaxID=66431 RepID=A0ABN3WV68_STRTU